MEKVMLMKKMYSLACKSFVGSNIGKQKYIHKYDNFNRVFVHNKKVSLT